MSAVEQINVSETLSTQFLPTTRNIAGKRRRLVLSFSVCVLMPLFAVLVYLETIAEDQFASEFSFSIRSASDVASDGTGLATPFSGSGNDYRTRALLGYLHSQDFVLLVDRDIGLRRMWGKHAATDRYFSLGHSSSDEQLTSFWSDMVTFESEPTTGIIDVSTTAFSPEDAHAISQSILHHSREMAEQLSNEAQSEILRELGELLADAEEVLKRRRGQLTQLKQETQIVDPENDIDNQMGVISELQRQLANELVAMDLLRQQTTPQDARIRHSERLIKALNDRIRDQRQHLGMSSSESNKRTSFELATEFDGLEAEVEFAEKHYLSLFEEFEAARRRVHTNAGYIVVHIPPSFADSSSGPDRTYYFSLIGGLAFLFWALGIMIWKSFRENF